jgi:hypothetical protein
VSAGKNPPLSFLYATLPQLFFYSLQLNCYVIIHGPEDIMTHRHKYEALTQIPHPSQQTIAATTIAGKNPPFPVYTTFSQLFFINSNSFAMPQSMALRMSRPTNKNKRYQHKSSTNQVRSFDCGICFVPSSLISN